MYLKAALDDTGKPKAWLQRSVFPPIGSTFNQNEVYGSAGEMSLGWDLTPFDVPNFRSENGQAAAHVRVGWLRSVANIYHAFAVQSFANELAYAANRDPYDYLLTLLGSARNVDPGPKGSPGSRRKISLRYRPPAPCRRVSRGKSKLGQNQTRQRQ